MKSFILGCLSPSLNRSLFLDPLDGVTLWYCSAFCLTLSLGDLLKEGITVCGADLALVVCALLRLITFEVVEVDGIGTSVSLSSSDMRSLHVDAPSVKSEEHALERVDTGAVDPGILAMALSLFILKISATPGCIKPLGTSPSFNFFASLAVSKQYDFLFLPLLLSIGNLSTSVLSALFGLFSGLESGSLAHKNSEKSAGGASTRLSASGSGGLSGGWLYVHLLLLGVTLLLKLIGRTLSLVESEAKLLSS